MGWAYGSVFGAVLYFSDLFSCCMQGAGYVISSCALRLKKGEGLEGRFSLVLEFARRFAIIPPVLVLLALGTQVCMSEFCMNTRRW